MAKKKPNPLSKAVMDFTKAGVASGVGVTAVESVGSDATAIKTATSYFPTIANVKMAGVTLKEVKKLKKLRY